MASTLVLAAGLVLAIMLAAPALETMAGELVSRIETGTVVAAEASGSDGIDPPDPTGGDAGPRPIDPSDPAFGRPPPPDQTEPWPDFEPGIEQPEALVESLHEIQSIIDAGDDNDMSERELNRVRDRLAELTPDELSYILANLTDEQIERLFDNAYSSGILSLDWSDDDRAIFYENLRRADQDQRNRLAEVLADSTRLDEDEYLDILHRLEVDVSNGEKPNGAAIDELIEAALDPDHIDGPISDGDIAAGRVITVNDEDYERAWREYIADRSEAHQAVLEQLFENSRGFVDDEGRLWVKDSGSETPGTAIHEAIHGYSDPALEAEALNEGVTEYFTREVIKTTDDPATPEDEAQETLDERGYGANYQFVEQLVGVVGEDAVAAAYFDGDIDALEQAYKDATNRDSDDFDKMMDLVDSRHGADWTAAGDLLTVVPES